MTKITLGYIDYHVDISNNISVYKNNELCKTTKDDYFAALIVRIAMLEQSLKEIKSHIEDANI